jgi:hypothetical protein
MGQDPLTVLPLLRAPRLFAASAPDAAMEKWYVYRLLS